MLALARGVCASVGRREIYGGAGMWLMQMRKMRCISRRPIGSVAASRYASSSVWDEAAEAYFAKDEPKQGSGSSTMTTEAYFAKDEPKQGSGSKHSPTKQGSGSKHSSTTTTEAYFAKDEPKQGSGSKHSSTTTTEDFDDLGPRIEQGRTKDSKLMQRKKVLPEGMQRRMKQAYSRTGFPAPRTGGYQRFKVKDEEEDRPSEVPRLRGEALYGVAPIRAAVRARRRDLHTLYIQEKLDEDAPGKKKAVSEVRWILRTANSLNLTTVTVTKHVLNMLADNRPHQGMVLDASPLDVVEVTALDTPLLLGGRKAPVWIALDEVQDPQNLGAIMRSAHFFGAAGVVICCKNSAPLSGVVSKASAGALEVMEVLSCRNMMKFLRDSVVRGWRAVGTSSDAEAMRVSEMPKSLPTILVLGNEGVGVRTNVMEACSHTVRIAGALPCRNKTKKRGNRREEGDELAAPASSEDGSLRAELQKLLQDAPEIECLYSDAGVDSLNVSVAAGILLHEFINHGESL